MKKSYVYLVEQGTNYKIGKSDNPKLRLSSLQTGNVGNLQLLYMLEFDSQKDALKAELALHNKFKHLHVKGEWFNLNRSDIEDFKNFSKCVLVTPSKFDHWLVGIDFIDTFAAMSKREQRIIKLVKDCIKWDKSLNSFNYVVSLPPDSVEFDPQVEDYVPYNTFQKAFGTLFKQDIMRRVKRHHYMLNPEFLIPSGELAAHFEIVWNSSKQFKD